MSSLESSMPVAETVRLVSADMSTVSQVRVSPMLLTNWLVQPVGYEVRSVQVTVPPLMVRLSATYASAKGVPKTRLEMLAVLETSKVPADMEAPPVNVQRPEIVSSAALLAGPLVQSRRT